MDVSRDTLIKIFGRDRVDDELYDIIDEILKNPEYYRQKVLELYENEKAENPEICKECGGRCCLRAPCHWSPRDFENLSFKALKKLLEEKQYISVVRFPGDIVESCFKSFKHKGKYFYVLRTRTRSTGLAIVSNKKLKSDRCMLLTPNGCKLPFSERARGARLLIPEKNRKCRHLYDMDECIEEWKDYQDVLRKLFYYFRVKEKANMIRIKKRTLVKDQ